MQDRILSMGGGKGVGSQRTLASTLNTPSHRWIPVNQIRPCPPADVGDRASLRQTNSISARLTSARVGSNRIESGRIGSRLYSRSPSGAPLALDTSPGAAALSGLFYHGTQTLPTRIDDDCSGLASNANKTLPGFPGASSLNDTTAGDLSMRRAITSISETLSLGSIFALVKSSM